MPDRPENQPAFPHPWVSELDGKMRYERGMSLRDWFAGQAALGIAGYLTNLDAEETAEEIERLAKGAYLIANAMLLARGEQ